MAGTERVLVGTLGKAHGLRGDLTVRLSTDSPDRRFADGAVVEVGEGGRPLTVRGSHWHSGVLLLSFEGVTDRTAAERLRGADVWARVNAAEEPEVEGEFHDRSLIGLQAAAIATPPPKR